MKIFLDIAGITLFILSFLITIVAWGFDTAQSQDWITIIAHSIVFGVVAYEMGVKCWKMLEKYI